MKNLHSGMSVRQNLKSVCTFWRVFRVFNTISIDRQLPYTHRPPMSPMKALIRLHQSTG